MGAFLEKNYGRISLYECLGGLLYANGKHGMVHFSLSPSVFDGRLLR